ncbi:lipopolysaccharide biosynthesis protein RfbH [Paenibacillus elgii]|uniref:Lipopolysaccharide biosynthesis protein RfbH n=1 Tax=Paenibacillus elgii TaxID=189691 RepID=A0A2T6G6W3_9BACL|nr:lipopolysaccharide biosynthesis protein RfbH [Paenibacillus elgii]PUA39892.1 lipopolysaccharide biosynthesis protein RfbH [Paenibacillus elgii]
MYQLGDVIQISGKLETIIEVNGKTVITYDSTNESGKYSLNYANKNERLKEELEQSEYVGCIEHAELEKIKRKLIFEKVVEFHDLFHGKPEFIRGQSNLSYAGKVYDQNEMVALTDASLDFWLTSGRYTKQFEKELAEYLGVKYALLTNSGSSANLLAISALTSPKLGEKRLMPGDEVITVAAGFPTTVAPIVQNKLVPVFVDVDLGTYNIKVNEIEQAISSKTKAIMIAHTMGNPFNLDAVVEIAKKYDLWLIEDNCDALGSRYNGQLTGTFGHIGTSSFYPPHHITMGEGGAVYTNDPILKLAIESFRDWGRDCWCPSGCDNTCKKRFGWQLGQLPYGYDHKYTYSHLGYNLKVTDMQAAIGTEQLKKLPLFIERRIHNFDLLKSKLNEVKDDLILPEATEKSQPSWFGFILTVKDSSKISRNKITEFLEQNKVQTRMLFAGNLIKQPAFNGVEYRLASSLSNTDKIMNDTFLVGVYPGLDDNMIDYMAKQIVEAVKIARI